MILKKITILNYKNIADATIEPAPGVNCLIGNNGQGKTNVLDAVYCLSMCRSFTTGGGDSALIKHGEEYMMLQGKYLRRDLDEDITLSLKRGGRKVVKRQGKEYRRLSKHIGLLPIVMISPMDWDLIRGAGDERRRLMDTIISQGDTRYLDALIRYNKALEQRNSMIRHEYTDALLYTAVEQQMTEAAALIYERRSRWIEDFTPIFMTYYRAIAGSGESVSLSYRSHLNEAPSLQAALDATRQRDLVIGYTTRGIHRDDIELLLDGYSMRRTGSQGQCKTYTIALRLAQFEFLKRINPTTPILLLDDIFDKLDATRVESIIRLVTTTPSFGQIFITDTNRTHIDNILANTAVGQHALWHVENGAVTRIDNSNTGHDDETT